MNIREATVKDADDIVSLVNKYAKKGQMLAKTPYKVFSTIQIFL